MTWQRAKFGTQKERKALLGQTIRWANWDRNYIAIRPDGEGLVQEVSGKNLEVDMFGSRDWLWTPDLEWIEIRVDEKEDADA